MAAKVAEGQTTINSLKKDFNATIKAADANALIAKQNDDARIKAADTNALMGGGPEKGCKRPRTL